MCNEMIGNLTRRVFNAPQRAALALLGQHVAMGENSKHAQELAEIPQADTTKQVLANLSAETASHRTVYVSTPITGGERLYDFLEAHGASAKSELKDSRDIQAYGREVVKANVHRAEKRAEQLRKSGLLVINPTAVSIPQWGQTEYNRNWVEVLSKINLAAVMLCPGWQLSYGCLLEVRTALDRGIPVNDEKNRPLTRSSALRRVTEAVSEVKSKGLKVADLPKVLTEPFETLPMEA